MKVKIDIPKAAVMQNDKNWALGVAIKALKQEPCEDCISRKDVLDALEQEEPLVWCDGADEIAAYNQWSSDVNTIKNIPSVQPKYNTDEWCKTCSEYNHDKHCCPRYNKVIRSAVEEIKQPCEDTISRQAVLDKKQLVQLEDGQSFYCISPEDVETLPSVTPQPKTGHWVLLDECSNSGYYCSECHKKLVKEGWSDTVKKIKFCPNCGSRMKMKKRGQGMITLEMGQLYGMNSEKELMQTIKELKNTGMSDDDIQVILDRSKAESEET